MATKPRDYQAMLLRLQLATYFLICTIAILVILYVIFSILGKFYQTILLFVIGAILAYLLVPIVNLIQRGVRKRWLAILSVYAGVALVLVILAIVLIDPFVTQAQSLANNLQTPSAAGLKQVRTTKDDAARVLKLLSAQQAGVAKGSALPPQEVQQARREIAALQRRVSALSAPSSTVAVSGGVPAPHQVKVPPSYLHPIAQDVAKLSTDYAAATAGSGTVDAAALKNAVVDAGGASKAVNDAYQKMSSLPLLLLQAQTWLDDHGFSVDLNQRFGQALNRIDSQAASLVNNAANIVLTAGTLMINVLLMLIISVYFLSDGPRLVRKATQIGPRGYRARAPFYVASLDRVMGAYIRGQIILAFIAAILGAGGAAVLGVPYAVLIGISTFLLILIPVIGPVILVVPPVLIAAIFTPVTTTVILLVYFLIMMQVVTNILGPRIVGSSVGIHPLEAMAAALVGFPLAGFLGSFFAVPIVGFFHIVVREALDHWKGGPLEALEAPLDDSQQLPASGPASGTAAGTAGT